jgi:hypothetical protein
MGTLILFLSSIAGRALSFSENRLAARERVLLFRAASGTNWQHAGITGENVTAMVVKGFITRDAAGEIALTDGPRAPDISGHAARLTYVARGRDVRAP